tara:strand:+ start:249 stop:3371 length:3123 start_codon:yes stop_codon:yes gene_type:complete
MTTVSQRVPSLLLGISQQPDHKKIPGQVVNALNAYPDFVNGLVKRPGAEFFGELVKPGTDPDKSFWTNIVRDETEKYLVQYDIASEQFKVYKHPVPRVVETVFDTPPLLEQKGVLHKTSSTTYTTSYDSTADTYNTALQDRQSKLTTLNQKQYEYKQALDGQNPTVESKFELKETYNNQGEIVQRVNSGIVLNTSGVYTVTLNGSVISASTTLPTGYAQGNERTDEHPLLTRNGERIFEVDQTIAATHNATQLATALSAMNAADTALNTADSTLATARTNLETAITNNNSLCPSGSYLDNITDPSQIAVLNVIDKTFVVNKSIIPQMSSTLTAGNINEAFIVISIVQAGSTYTVQLVWRNTSNTVVGFDYTVTASSTNPSAATIVTDLANIINNGSGVAPGTNTNGSGGELAHEIVATVVGNGIHLVRGSGGNYSGPFDIETRGSAHQDGIYGFTHELTNSSKLPIQCVDGYRVKITNSDDTDADDYYVKFVASSTVLGYGAGSWEETVAPGIKYKFDPETMPHLLTRDANGHFTFEPATYEERIVGDNDTNPIPSFIGKLINGVFVYRNRLGFLAGDSIVMSRADDFFNFWNKTALTSSDDDPIDVDCTSTKPQTLRYVVPQSTGLVVFGQNEQFLLSTSSDILSPKTAKVNRLSTFDTSENVAPVNTGIAIGFVNTTSNNTRHFEIFDVSSDTTPKAAETSLPVSDLIPDNIDLYDVDPNLSVFSLTTKNKKELFIYRYLQQGERRVIEGWFKWESDQEIQYQYFDKGCLYVVTQEQGYDRLYLSRIALQQHSNQGVVRSATYIPFGAGSGEVFVDTTPYRNKNSDVHLDRFIQGTRKTYNSTTDQTTVQAPYLGFDTVLAFTDFKLDSNNNIIDLQPKVKLFEQSSTNSSGNQISTVVLQGDLRDALIFVGKSYRMEVTLPSPYVTGRSGDSFVTDTSANLIIHRIKVQAGFGGQLEYRLAVLGKETNNNTASTIFPPYYNADTLPVAIDLQHTIHIHQRNTDFELTLFGDTPYPTTLSSYDWEGRYTTNFYKRQPY